MNYRDDSDYPKMLDNDDPLKRFRQRFYHNDGENYLRGNSFGLASIDAEKALINLIEMWKKDNIKLFSNNNSKYLYYSRYLANLMSPLVNARPEEVAVTGSTTGNLHQAISTLYKPTRDKYKILVDDVNFPSDRYAVDSQVRLRGLDPKEAVKVVRCEGKFMDEDKIIRAMTPDVALVLLSAVYYRTAQILDMKRISKVAVERNIMIGWDLSHAIGLIEMDLPSLNVDFAVWCTYKNLNGGPGSCASLYVNSKHFEVCPGLTGWFGNRMESQFSMRQEFEHEQDASGWQIGAPCLFSMATLEGTLQMFKEAGLANIRKKSLHLTGYLMYLIDKKLSRYGFSVGNPREDERRGGHVCLEHCEAGEIWMALKARGVCTDYKPPGMLRVGPAALYTSFAQIYEFVDTVSDIMEREAYVCFREVAKPLL